MRAAYTLAAFYIYLVKEDDIGQIVLVLKHSGENGTGRTVRGVWLEAGSKIYHQVILKCKINKQKNWPATSN